MKVILASASPRRREILAALGCEFEIISADIDENIDETDPAAHVRILARNKAEAVRPHTDGDALIIAADTVVSVDSEILGKPRDRADAERMLRALSGRRHSVISGIAVSYRGKTLTAAEVTEVKFKTLGEGELEAYLNTDEPYDKAGAYAAQGLASLFIEGLHGDYFNVVGLPVHRLYTLLAELDADAVGIFKALRI